MSTAIAVQEKPILFSGAMVRKIIEDLKTNTRRVAKLACELADKHKRVNVWRDNTGRYSLSRDAMHTPELRESFWLDCPYGKPGDRLWVRESGKLDKETKRIFLYNSTPGICRVKDLAVNEDYHPAAHAYKSVPSIHMPRWASRLTVEIVSVKVEKVQQISEDDAIAEGVEYHAGVERWRSYDLIGQTPFCSSTAKDSFLTLWDSINAKREGGKYAWAANPWVWAIEFRRLDT